MHVSATKKSCTLQLALVCVSCRQQIKKDEVWKFRVVVQGCEWKQGFRYIRTRFVRHVLLTRPQQTRLLAMVPQGGFRRSEMPAAQYITLDVVEVWHTANENKNREGCSSLCWS